MVKVAALWLDNKSDLAPNVYGLLEVGNDLTPVYLGSAHSFSGCGMDSLGSSWIISDRRKLPQLMKDDPGPVISFLPDMHKISKDLVAWKIYGGPHQLALERTVKELICGQAPVLSNVPIAVKNSWKNARWDVCRTSKTDPGTAMAAYRKTAKTRKTSRTKSLRKERHKLLKEEVFIHAIKIRKIKLKDRIELRAWFEAQKWHTWEQRGNEAEYWMPPGWSKIYFRDPGKAMMFRLRWGNGKE